MTHLMQTRGLPVKPFFSLNLLFAAYATFLKLQGVQLKLYIALTPELQKGGILVFRIPDISGRKSGHFQIVSANLSIFGIKRLQHYS